MIIKPPSNPTKKQCILYLRVSSAQQTSDGAGLSSQERRCRDYAELSGYQVAEIFTDAISGRHADRPGMNELLAFLRAEQTKPYIVVLDDITRFARDVSTHATLRDKITACGATIESPTKEIQ
ncbi:recombinase family protein [Phaeobacter sp. J2-8]|uniref:recombinase family protein n=1 Tax=Phaeobacter sp. J2-8 TaxID=2931394 RepID=UPI001FD59AE8|nr:recombinase family protein [Phaeobacter sp. J2-8]MCJ7871520.1 recombinase family protein [Phaeobacter sp. J2-8]